ncbi:MAG: hypothetical protein UHD07_05130 [Ruminobacter sp.]|nr:hypothetical protein [Ruminobacter sp.]
MQYITQYESPFGMITLASDGKYLIGLWFLGQENYGNTLDYSNDIAYKSDLAIFKDVTRWLDCYFDANIPCRLPNLKILGTKLQLAVWKCLMQIPRGSKLKVEEFYKFFISRNQEYKSIVSLDILIKTIESNSLSILIPSHRVVGRGRRLCYPAGAAVLSLLQLIEYKSIEGFNNSEKMLLSEFLGIQMNDGEDELEDIRRYAQAA